MHTLPRPITHVLRSFELLFSEQIWKWANILPVGVILTPGTRTAMAALQVMRLSDEGLFQNYHPVLNWVPWLPRGASRVPLCLLVQTFLLLDALIVFGLDDHIECRRGAKIAAKGIYHSPVYFS